MRKGKNEHRLFYVLKKEMECFAMAPKILYFLCFCPEFSLSHSNYPQKTLHVPYSLSFPAPPSQRSQRFALRANGEDDVLGCVILVGEKKIEREKITQQRETSPVQPANPSVLCLFSSLHSVFSV